MNHSVTSSNSERQKVQMRLEEICRNIEQSTHKLILLEQEISLIDEDIERYIDEETKLTKHLNDME